MALYFIENNPNCISNHLYKSFMFNFTSKNIDEIEIPKWLNNVRWIIRTYCSLYKYSSIHNQSLGSLFNKLV